MVRNAAELIWQTTTPPAERDALTPLGRDYIKRFVTAHPRMKKVRQRPQEKERILGQQRNVFTEYFHNLGEVI